MVARHQVGCPAVEGKRCRCEPGYVARVWDRTRRRPVSSPTYRTPAECLQWQLDQRQAMKNRIAQPVAPTVPTNLATHATVLAQASDRVARP
jgi:hypothetical protein